MYTIPYGIHYEYSKLGNETCLYTVYHTVFKFKMVQPVWVSNQLFEKLARRNDFWDWTVWQIQTQINIWIMKELMPYRLKLFYRNWVSPFIPDRNWPTNRYSDWPWYSGNPGCIKLGQKGHWSVDQTRFLKNDNLVSYLYV